MALVGVAALVVLAAPSIALALPDGRGYEMVTPVDKNGNEVGPATPSTDGNSADWQAIGGCCGATSAASTLYRSTRSSGGWQTTAETPTPPGPLVGLFEEQQPVWYSGDLTKTIYTTPASYASGNTRPPSPSASPYLDLYEQGPGGAMTWLTQGPFAGAGTNPVAATFATATSDGNSVAFNTTERLTPDATGLASLNTPPQFLYVRNISSGTTTLVDVTTTTLSSDVSSGAMTIPVESTSAFAPGQTLTIGNGPDQETDTVASIPDPNDIDLTNALNNNHNAAEPVEALISADGAIAGNGNWLGQGFEPADLYGSTTNAVSSDGTKVFFESPPTFAGGGGSAEGVGPSHLYMRNLTTNTTTPIDDPSSTGGAVYEGASQSGSLVFFTSDEGLAGDGNTNNELYEFNTATGTVTALSNDAGNTNPTFVGVTAISNDGSHIWFVDKDALPGALANPSGATPNQGDMNLYDYNTSQNTTTFVGAVGSGIPGDNRDKTLLAGEPDINRAAIPTPNGSVLVFESTANLTSQNPAGPTTTLTADTDSATNDQPVSIPVASSAGFLVGRTVQIEDPIFSESATIMGIPDSTHLLVTDSGIGLIFPHSSGTSVVQRPPAEVYRYSAQPASLTCVSCTPAGVTPSGSAGLGASYGGSYGPAYESVPMSSDGTRIFFTSPDPLTPGVISSPPIPTGLFGGLTFIQNVYEWENGTVSLISDGHSATGSSLGGTTPSGNDVFFTTEDQLVPQDLDGYDDIYDARVGGGFPAPPAATPPCASSDTCRTSLAPTVFFPTPASTTLVNGNVTTPSFTVNSISAKQRKQLAKTGALTLSVRANQAGKISAVMSALMGGGRMIVDTVNRSLFATGGGAVKLTVHLNKAARRALASKHKLVVDIAVSYSRSNVVDIATLTLTSKKGKGKAKDVAARRSGTPRHARKR